MNLFRVFLAIVACFAAGAHAGSNPDLILLAATFNDRPPNAQIGTGGAINGEPVSIPAQLQAFVVPPGVLPTQALRITPLASGSARLVRFEFLNSNEISAGNVVLSFVLKPAQLGRFLIGVREQGSAAESFVNMALLDNGSIAVSDAADPAGALIADYVAGELLIFELRFRMDTTTYDIFLNGSAVASNRNHGIIARGVGALLLGTDSTTVIGSNWFVDDVFAYRPDALFINGFE